jgi:hypothetical protein
MIRWDFCVKATTRFTLSSEILGYHFERGFAIGHFTIRRGTRFSPTETSDISRLQNL